MTWREWLTVPNFFTLLRVLLTPLVVQATLAGEHTRALVLFFAAGITDVLDGGAARRFGATSRVGAYFDPIADKVLLSAVYLALAGGGMVPWWFVGLVLGRDVLILAAAGGFLLATEVRKFPPSQLGKLSTFFQISAAIAWMVRNASPVPWVNATAWALLWTSAVVTLASGIDYAVRGVRMVRAGN